MGDVVEFRCARAICEQCDPDSIAEQLIAELGPEAGYRVGYLARFAGLPPATSERLFRIAGEIERRQGFDWFFSEDHERLADRAERSATGAIRECADSVR